MTSSEKTWCPNCSIDRSGDDLSRPCECMARPERERNRRLRRAEMIGLRAEFMERFNRLRREEQIAEAYFENAGKVGRA